MILRGIEYTKLDKSRFGPLLKNWSYLQLFLGSIKDETELLKMIKYELDTKGRVQIIERIRTRFNKVRSEREKLEVLKSCF